MVSTTTRRETPQAEITSAVLIRCVSDDNYFNSYPSIQRQTYVKYDHTEIGLAPAYLQEGYVFIETDNIYPIRVPKTFPDARVTVPINTISSINPYIFLHSLNFRVLLLQKQKRIDAALDVIFEKIDEKLISEEFNTIDFFLRNINVVSFTEDILIGILTITLPFRKSLRNRVLFYENVERHLNTLIHNPVEAQRILYGLKD